MIAYWLMPASPSRDFFSALIAELAQRFDAPRFEPQLTIYVEKASHDRAASLIEEVAADFGQMRMSVAGLRFSEEFFKTVFVQFFPSAALMRLSEAVQGRSIDASGYDLDPHPEFDLQDNAGRREK